MTTKNPRISVTFDSPILEILGSLSKKEQKSISSIAKELICEALELREDIALSKIAEDSEKRSKRRKTVSHEDAWK